MVSRDLTSLINTLSDTIISAPDKLSPSERNEEWTKMVLILPLLEGLGWNKAIDISYESSPDDTEGWLDFIMKSQPQIGIEAKALDVNYPLDCKHPHVLKGLKQSRERGASYFIWTNGDCWQFFSLELENAPLYQVILSSVGDGTEQAESVANKLQIIEKEYFTEKPKIFDQAIRNNWKLTALPEAWNNLIEKNMSTLFTLISDFIPSDLGINETEIMEFLKTLKPKYDVKEPMRSRAKLHRKTFSFPDDWEKLISSYEPVYERSRKLFNKDYASRFANFLTSNRYEPWSKSTTWRHVGVPNDTSERKKLGPVVTLFLKWGFIEQAEITDKYNRVEESVPYLQKLLEKTK